MHCDTDALKRQYIAALTHCSTGAFRHRCISAQAHCSARALRHRSFTALMQGRADTLLLRFVATLELYDSGRCRRGHTPVAGHWRAGGLNFFENQSECSNCRILNSTLIFKFFNLCKGTHIVRKLYLSLYNLNIDWNTFQTHTFVKCHSLHPPFIWSKVAWISFQLYLNGCVLVTWPEQCADKHIILQSVIKRIAAIGHSSTRGDTVWDLAGVSCLESACTCSRQR